MLRRLLLTASLLVVAWVAWRAWPEIVAAVDTMRSISPALMAVALLLEAVAVAALAQVYRASIAAVGWSVGYRQGLQLSMGAFTLSRVMPGGGAAGAVWAARRLRRLGLPWAQAGSAVVTEGVVAMAALGLIVTGGAVAALFRGRVGVAAVVAACLLGAVVGVLGWAATRLVRSAAARAWLFDTAQRVAPGAQRRLTAWRAALDDLAASMPAGRAVRRIMAWSAVNWLLDIGALWVVFLGLGLQLEIGVLVLGFGVANLVTALPHTPGGLGLVEAGMAGTYIALGTDTSVALAAVLAYRLISFWLPVLVGVPQYLRGPVGHGAEQAAS